MSGVDVDEDAGTREPEPHRGNQALAAGQHAGFGAVFLQMRERLVGGMGPKVLEGCRNHVANLLPRMPRVATPRDVAKTILRKN